MNKQVMAQILDKIRAYDRILIFRHIRNDGDCVGASKGLKRILQQSFPEKEILLIDSECAQYLAFMGPEDEDVADEVYAQALGIVVDTASEARISNKKYALCKELIKIDHHIPLENYGVLAWVEEEMSSCCEMIVKFYDTFRDRIHAFIDQVDGGCKPEEIDGSGREGLEASRVIHAMIRSIEENGAPIQVKDIVE